MTDSADTTSIKRILVALDGSAHGEAALQAATELAAKLDAKLRGYFVKDRNLLRLAELPFTQEVGYYSAALSKCDQKDMHRQLDAQARRLEELLSGAASNAQVTWSFDVIEGNVSQTLLDAASRVDLVAVGRTGRSEKEEKVVGSTTETLAMRAGVPVMILQAGTRLPSSVFILYDGTPEADRAIRTGAELAATNQYMPVNVLVLDNQSSSVADLKQRALTPLRNRNLPTIVRTISSLSDPQLAHFIYMSQGGLLLTPSSTLENDPSILHQLLEAIPAPLIVVR